MEVMAEVSPVMESMSRGHKAGPRDP